MRRKSPSSRAKQAKKAKSNVVLAYDLGGTKVAVGVVDAKGNILEDQRVPVILEQGKEAVLQQLADLGNVYLKKYPKVRRVGMASAGPLDPAKGELLDPTNFASQEGTWGKVPITTILGKKLKRPVVLENDAAAAMLAERWMGAAKGYDNAMILTLGTGLGTGIICNGELVRAGRGTHPEAGHIVVNFDDPEAPAICGCGVRGCAEAYLSGKNFERRARHRLNEPSVTAKEVADRARAGDARARELFAEYSRVLAIALHNYAVIYAPEIIVFTGSFANAADLFLDAARVELERLLVRRREGIDFMPKLAVSKLENEAGLLGGAYVALTR